MERPWPEVTLILLTLGLSSSKASANIKPKSLVEDIVGARGAESSSSRFISEAFRFPRVICPSRCDLSVARRSRLSVDAIFSIFVLAVFLLSSDTIDGILFIRFPKWRISKCKGVEIVTTYLANCLAWASSNLPFGPFFPPMDPVQDLPSFDRCCSTSSLLSVCPIEAIPRA